MPAKIVVQDLAKSFPSDGGRLSVLDGVSFTVDEGELVAIVGPSGCGKSTLLNIAAGFERGDRGSVLVDGAEMTGPSARGILISQHGSVFPWLTVRQNLMFGLNGHALNHKESLANRYAEMVGLKGFEASYPHELSGGMLKRAELARALVVKPDILYMDEPFATLDVEEASHVADRILVLSPRPARVQAVFEVPIKRPRRVASPEVQELRAAILRELGVDALSP